MVVVAMAYSSAVARALVVGIAALVSVCAFYL